MFAPMAKKRLSLANSNVQQLRQCERFSGSISMAKRR